MFEAVSPADMRRFVAQTVVRQCQSDEVKQYEEYYTAMECGVEAGQEVLEADPAAGKNAIRQAIINAISPHLSACKARLNKHRKEQARAESAGDGTQATPPGEETPLAALLPGMDDVVAALAGEGLTTVQELESCAKRNGMLTLSEIPGLDADAAKQIIDALYRANYDIARYAVMKGPAEHDPESPIDRPDRTPAADETEQREAEAEAEPSLTAETDMPETTPPGEAEPEPPGPSPAAPGVLTPRDTGLPTAVITKLNAVGINTYHELLGYIRDNGGIQDVPGIGPQSAGQIADFIENPPASMTST